MPAQPVLGIALLPPPCSRGWPLYSHVYTCRGSHKLTECRGVRTCRTHGSRWPLSLLAGYSSHNDSVDLLRHNDLTNAGSTLFGAAPSRSLYVDSRALRVLRIQRPPALRCSVGSWLCDFADDFLFPGLIPDGEVEKELVAFVGVVAHACGRPLGELLHVDLGQDVVLYCRASLNESHRSSAEQSGDVKTRQFPVTPWIGGFCYSDPEGLAVSSALCEIRPVGQIPTVGNLVFLLVGFAVVFLVKNAAIEGFEYFAGDLFHGWFGG